MTLRYQEENLRDEESDAPVVHVQVTLQSGAGYRFTETLKERKGYYSKGFASGRKKTARSQISSLGIGRDPAEGTVKWQQREQPSIDMLQWNRKSYTLAEGKVRRALLYAPWPLVANDDEWILSVTPEEHVRVLAQSLSFLYDYDLDAGVCVVDLASDGLDEPGIIIASNGDQSASAMLRFSTPRPGDFRSTSRLWISHVEPGSKRILVSYGSMQGTLLSLVCWARKKTVGQGRLRTLSSRCLPSCLRRRLFDTVCHGRKNTAGIPTSTFCSRRLIPRHPHLQTSCNGH